MEYNGKETKIMILCILGIICVVIVSIISLIGVWTRNDEQKIDDVEKVDINRLGAYQDINWNLDNQVSEYSDSIITFLITKNIDELYKITNPEYLDYFNLDKEGLRKVLTNKGLYGNVLNTNGYNYSNFKGNRYIRINVISEKNSYVDETINLIEYSPNDYKISFDKFIFYKKEPVTYIREELNITISNQVAYDKLYKFDLKITNNSDNSIYLNSSGEHEFMYLKDYSNLEVGPAVHLYSGQKVEISKNKTITMKLTFDITDMSIGSVQSFVIKGVELSKTGVVTDIELGL